MGLAGAGFGFPPHRSRDGASSPAIWQVLRLSRGLASSKTLLANVGLDELVGRPACWLSRSGSAAGRPALWSEPPLEARVPSGMLVACAAGAERGTQQPAEEKKGREKLRSGLRLS